MALAVTMVVGAAVYMLVVPPLASQHVAVTSDGIARAAVVSASGESGMVSAATPRLRREGDDVVAHPGQLLTYTVYTENRGQGELDDQSWTDDLSPLKPYVEMHSSTQDLAKHGMTFDEDSWLLTWHGDLAAQEKRELQFVVQIKEDFPKPETTLPNVVTGPGSNCYPDQQAIPPACHAPDVHVYDMRKLVRVTKEIDKEKFVTPGDDLTYTLTIANNADIDVPGFELTDDLTHVLPDVGEVTDITATGTSVQPRLEGNAIRWDADLPEGARVTITYKATVNKPDFGEHLLKNTAVTSTGNCTEKSPGPECTVEIPMGIAVTKKRKPDVVKPDRKATYTVTFTNHTGEPRTVTATDNLARVLDKTTWNKDAKAVIDGHAAATPKLDTKKKILTWKDAIPAGATATITYSITGKKGGAGELHNEVLTDFGTGQIIPE